MLFTENSSSNIWNLLILNCLKASKYIAVALFLSSAIPSQAQVGAEDASQDDPHKLYFHTSLATVHFHPDGQNNHQGLLDLEWNYKKDYLVGAGVFSNSFNQPTQVIYWGAKFHPFASSPNLFLELVGGFIHGYKDQYANSIPFNQLGTAPVILPAAGYCYKQVCSELIIFGTAGTMLTAGVKF